MIVINLKYKDERDVTNAIVKLQDWLDENGKWVFGWSQETKYMVVDTRNRMKVNIAKAIRHYEQYIRGSGHSFFDFMNWAKAQGKESPFVAFEDRLLNAFYYASATDTHNIVSANRDFEVFALRIDHLIQKAGTSVDEYREARDESVNMLCVFADRMFQKLIDNESGEEALAAFVSEQDKAGVLVDGVRPQWYMFSTGEESFAESLAGSLNYDLNELQKVRIRNSISIAEFHNLPQLANETIMLIKILLPKRRSSILVDLDSSFKEEFS